MLFPYFRDSVHRGHTLGVVLTDIYIVASTICLGILRNDRLNSEIEYKIDEEFKIINRQEVDHLIVLIGDEVHPMNVRDA